MLSFGDWPDFVMQTSITRRYKWGLLATIAISLLAIYPQVNLWMARGKEWKGSYVQVQGDEIAYSAYINALIDGRPRRNDAFMGRDDSVASPQAESLFSIQFIPAYTIALPARLLHLSSSTTFILLIVLISISSALAIFWLVRLRLFPLPAAVSAGPFVSDLFRILLLYLPSVCYQ